MKKFTKPFIPFDSFPTLYAKIWLKDEYQKCSNEDECIEFAFKCLKESESDNEARSKDCFIVFNHLYQLATGISYQSKIAV